MNDAFTLTSASQCRKWAAPKPVCQCIPCHLIASLVFVVGYNLAKQNKYSVKPTDHRGSSSKYDMVYEDDRHRHSDHHKHPSHKEKKHKHVRFKVI